MNREKKLKEVLSPLKGRSKDIMEAILKNVDTDQLDGAYKTFIGRVIREESEATSSEKEGTVLAEGASKKPAQKKTIVESTVMKTGDTDEVVTESEMQKTPAVDMARLRKIAGI